MVALEDEIAEASRKITQFSETESEFGAEQNRETDVQFVSETSDASSAQEPKLNVYEQSTADHKLVVLESLLQQVRSRKNPFPTGR